MELTVPATLPKMQISTAKTAMKRTTEIATMTGFSSASYLSRCFQEEYGCKTSEYARK